MHEQHADSLQLLLDLEARHEDLLRELDDLDKRIVTVLNEHTGNRKPETSDNAATETEQPSQGRGERPERREAA